LTKLDVSGFVSQNRDDIHVDIIQLLLDSAKQNVASLGQHIFEIILFIYLFICLFKTVDLLKV